MKKIFTFIAIASLFTLASCELDLYPITSYNEGNVTVSEETGSQYTSRSDMEGIRNSIYNSWMKNIQEIGFEDFLIYSECRADNAYCGTNSVEIMDIEANKQDASNKNTTRDWSWYLGQASNATDLIENIEAVQKLDPSLTDAEKIQWTAEAKLWRAWNWFQMSRLFGGIPIVTTIPPAITAENLEEVYHEYYPNRNTLEEVYAAVVEDLEFAAQNGPAVDPANKMLLSKAFALGMLARVYAEKPIRDWAKVSQYCTQVEGMGFKLVDNYDDLFAYNDTDANRNLSEAICEVQWSRASGNWVYMMFHRNAYSPGDSYSWAKWVTPSRDLIAAFDAEGDAVRKNASIIFDECGWSNYYPSNEYAFMHKMRTNASGIYLMRLAEIYLLHAEALCMTGDQAGAASYVNKVRQRVGLNDISSSLGQNEMLDAILKERRLELAFEGFRFYDLMRHDKAADICANVVKNDPYWLARDPMTEESSIMPVPQTVLDNNPSIEQNPGY